MRLRPFDRQTSVNFLIRGMEELGVEFDEERTEYVVNRLNTG